MSKTHKEATYVYSFPQTDRVKSLEKILSKTATPGPGEYNPVKVSLSSFPKIRIGTSQRKHNLRNLKIPTVGDYNLESTIGQAPKITMSAKFYPKENTKKIHKVKPIPGPGFYDPDVNPVRLRFPKYTMRPKTVIVNKNIKNPGPEKYNPNKDPVKRRPMTVKFDKEKKFRNQKLTYQTTPAPNKYKLRSELEFSTNPKITINGVSKSKRRVDNTKSNPGPGFYFTKEKDNDAVKIKMSFYRPMDEMFACNKNPGPGVYNPNLKNKRLAPQIT